MPGAQVNLVTAAEAALNQEPKESGEGWQARPHGVIKSPPSVIGHVGIMG